jgi:hypothetical protein
MIEIGILENSAAGQELVEPAAVLVSETSEVIVTELINNHQQH